MRFPLERGLGGFVEMYAAAHQRLCNNLDGLRLILRGLKKTSKEGFPQKFLIFRKVIFHLPLYPKFLPCIRK